jgi:hypothetical protein
MSATEFSDAALTNFARQVVLVHSNRIDVEKRITEAGGGAYVKRFTMACDVRRYDPDTGAAYLVTGHKFILIVFYDRDDIETAAMIGGINGQPPASNQSDPSTVTAPKSLPRKLMEYLNAQADIKSWRFIEKVDIAGPLPGAKVEITTATETKTIIISKDEAGMLEVSA